MSMVTATTDGQRPGTRPEDYAHARRVVEVITRGAKSSAYRRGVIDALTMAGRPDLAASADRAFAEAGADR